MEKEKIIMRSSDEAAQKKTVTGWVSRDGRFWGDNEEMARYAGCTHDTCKCGNIIRRGYSRCDECRNKQIIESYDKFPFVEWDGKTPLCIFDTDQYFWSSDDIDAYLEDEDLKPEDIRLVICTPNHIDPLSEEHFDNEMFPESWDGELPGKMSVLIQALNEHIKTLVPISWSAGGQRTKYIPK